MDREKYERKNDDYEKNIDIVNKIGIQREQEKIEAAWRKKNAERRHLLGDKAGARNDMTTNIPPTTTSNKKDGIDR